MPLPVATPVAKAIVPLLTRLGAGLASSGSTAGPLSKVLQSIGVGKKAANVAGGISNLANDTGFAIQGVKQIGGALAGFGKTAMALVNPLTYVNEAFKVAGAGIDLMLTPLTSLNKFAETVSGILGGIHATATGLSSSVQPFTDKANPTYGKMQSLASDDLAASFGHALIPAMQAGTAITRAFADVVFALSPGFTALNKAFFDPLTKILPSLVNTTEPVIGAFNRLNSMMAGVIGPAMSRTMDSLRESFESVMPAVGMMVESMGPTLELGLRTVATSMEVLAYTAKMAVAPLGALNKALGLGIGPGPKIANGSINAAGREGKFGGVEDFYKSVVLDAFKAGGPPPEKPFEVGTGYLGQILEQIKQYSPAAIAKAIADAIRGILPGGEAAADFVDQAGGILGGGGEADGSVLTPHFGGGGGDGAGGGSVLTADSLAAALASALAKAGVGGGGGGGGGGGASIAALALEKAREAAARGIGTPVGTTSVWRTWPPRG